MLVSPENFKALAYVLEVDGFDLYGRVSGYDKLYLVDGSLIPARWRPTRR